MDTLRFAILGTGFWSRYQMAGWKELEGVECVALYNRTRAKAEALGREFGIPRVYDHPEKLLDRERPDFVDIMTSVGTHARLVHASIVPCLRDLLQALLGEGPAETTGEDNLGTMRLVFAACRSAASGEVISLD